MSSTFLIFFKIFFNLGLTSLRTRQGFGASFISPSTVSSLYHILTALSRGILNFFRLVVVEISATWFQPARSGSHLYSAPLHPVRSDHGTKVLLALMGTRSLGRPALPFCTLIVSQLGRFVKGFLTFSQNFFSRAPTPVLHSQWQAFVYGYPLPLTMIVYHRPHQKSTGNVAQIRDF